MAERRPWQTDGTECGAMYRGQYWAPMPCVKPWNHPRPDGHADWYGRTWPYNDAEDEPVRRARAESGAES